MKVKSIVFLAGAICCGLVAMMGVQQAMSGNEETTQTVNVLVATVDIRSGTKLDETNSVFKPMPQELAEGAIVSREQCEDRALKIRAVAGQTILMGQLGEPGVDGVASQIPKGMRVVTVPVTATTSHSGQILPGHRVDVVCNYRVRSDKGSNQKTSIILQYVKVFAADSLRDASDADVQEVASKNVSLLVTPKQANVLLQAKSMGTLFLTMRSTNDDEEVDNLMIDEKGFDGFDTGIVKTEEDDEEKPVQAEAEPESVGDQLMAEMERKPIRKPDPEPEPEEVVEPEEPKWRITIYEGDERRDEFVSMPESALRKAEQDAATDAGASSTDWKSWKGLIQSYFNGT